MVSPVMFTLYLETVLKEVRNKIRVQDISNADDVDFLSKEGIDLTEVEKILRKWNLYMNNDKTEVLTKNFNTLCLTSVSNFSKKTLADARPHSSNE